MKPERAGDTADAIPDAARLRERVRELRVELERKESEVVQLANTVARQRRLEESLGWRLILRWRGTRDRLLQGSGLLRRAYATAGVGVNAIVRRKPERPAEDRIPPEDEPYQAWIKRHTPSPEDLERKRLQGTRLAVQPMFSIIVECDAPGMTLLSRAVESLAAQTWRRWEAIVVVADEGADAARSGIPVRLASDGRIRVEPISPAVGGEWDRITALARGCFVVFVSATDVLESDALQELALALEVAPEADVVYTDEDRITISGSRFSPSFKPGWSPDLLLSTNYIGQLAAYRRALLLEIGGPRGASEHFRAYDLALRFTERARQVLHVPKVLIHRQRDEDAAGDPRSTSAARDALAAAIERRRLDAVIEPTPFPLHRVRYAVRGAPTVSIVIPTKDRGAMLRTCIESIEQRSTWSHRELLVVDNGSTEPVAVRYLAELERRERVLRDPRPFNWSALNNAAAHEARGEYLLFLNNDVEVLSPSWIEAMLEHAQRDDVGVVGAMLLYPDRTIQHAGIMLGVGIAGHAFKHLPESAPTYLNLAHTVRDVSAVTGACMMVRRSLFQRARGFDERLRVAFNDVDFCLRLRASGALVVYTPYAVLIHHESATRSTLHPAADESLMLDRWCAVLGRDPYYNPNLTRERDDFAIR